MTQVLFTIFPLEVSLPGIRDWTDPAIARIEKLVLIGRFPVTYLLFSPAGFPGDKLIYKFGHPSGALLGI